VRQRVRGAFESIDRAARFRCRFSFQACGELRDMRIGKIDDLGFAKIWR